VLVLASASPFRRRLLEAAGLEFRVEPAVVDETALKRSLAARKPSPDAAAVANALARLKAETVSTRLPEALVIGADQVLALDDELFDKPHDAAEAREQLLRLRGRAHRLLTSAALAQAGRTVWQCVDSATLTMRAFSPDFVDHYLELVGGNISKALGGYQIEGLGIQLFERIEGDYFGIIGLPLLPLLAELRTRGVLAS
jgi:septum formation protein